MKKGSVALAGIALTGGLLVLVGAFQLTLGSKPQKQSLHFRFYDYDPESGVSFGMKVLQTLKNHGKVHTSKYSGRDLDVLWTPDRPEFADIPTRHYEDYLIEIQVL